MYTSRRLQIAIGPYVRTNNFFSEHLRLRPGLGAFDQELRSVGLVSWHYAP